MLISSLVKGDSRSRRQKGTKCVCVRERELIVDSFEESKVREKFHFTWVLA